MIAELKPPAPIHAARQMLSAIVISYNRVDIIGTCLRALAFADELIVIDKSSTDKTPQIASRYADRVISVDWTPTVEETREFAVSCAKHEWILLIDDDECLSVEAVRYIQEEMKAPRADVYALPQRHYILGIHDESAYYWPEFQPRLFRRGSLILSATVHGGTVKAPEAKMYAIPPETGACMHHLSHKNVTQWVEKTNRYTSNPDRLSSEDFSSDLQAYAHSRIDAFMAATKSDGPGDYPAAVAILRSLYDMIDRLKRWESENGIDGDASFQEVCARLNAEYDAAFPRRAVSGVAPERVDADTRGQGMPMSTTLAIDTRTMQVFQDALRHLRTTSEVVRMRTEELLQEQRTSFSAEKDRLRLLYDADVVRQRASFEAEAARLRQSYDEDLGRHLEKKATLEADRQALMARLHSLVGPLGAERERRKATEHALRATEHSLRLELDAERKGRRHAEHTLREANHDIETLLGSTSWRITGPLRAVVGALRHHKKRNSDRLRLLARVVASGDPRAREILRTAVRRRLGLASPTLAITSEVPSTTSADVSSSLAPHQAAIASYAAWSSRFDTPAVQHRKWLLSTVNELPPAGIICFFGEADMALVESTVAALRHQVGLLWTATLVFADGCDPTAVAQWHEQLASDPRFLSPCVLPKEDILVIVQAGALPRSHGPRLLVEALVRRPTARLAYGDEDRLNEQGLPHAPWFKPSYSELLVQQGLLLGRMTAIRAHGEEVRALMRHAGHIGPVEVDAAVARLALQAGKAGCVHVPHVVFHDALPARVAATLAPTLPDQLPLVSVIIPTRNGWKFLGPCLQSLRQTDWPADRLEVIVIDNGSDEPETLNGLRQQESDGFLRIVHDARPFNYSQLNNTAVRQSRGSLLVFLNNDTEVRDPSWLKQMAALALLPGAGAVGAKLLYGDGTVQHGGVILGVQGAAGHAHVNLGADQGGYMQLANVTREMSAVTGACLAMTREAFEEAGGFDEELRVAFNDIVLCLDSLRRGRRNIYLSAPILTHHESKTRGYDDTPEKIHAARRETCLAWFRHASVLRHDPSYSPNLSLEEPYALSFAPRRRPAWRSEPGSRLKVMMLSITHARGHGVAVVIDQQVSALVARGHEVVLAGHCSPNDFTYGGRPVLEVHDPRSVATLALDLEVDIIIAHTPPFFGVTRWTGAFPPVMSYDYGEPPPDLFPDSMARHQLNDIKNMELASSTAVYAISQAVADEAFVKPRGVLALANSHLGRWDEEAAARREAMRAREGWADRFVVLNVCRFGEGERRYKGVDTFAALHDALYSHDPSAAARAVFVLCGKGTEVDVAAMEEAGLEVRANVTDEEMRGLYAAADAYANFSLWEGYNLGIGQALAMGLPVVASDNPAHRAFGVSVCQGAEDAAQILAGFARQPRSREPVIWEWNEAMEAFVAAVEAVASEAPGPDWFPAR